MWYRFKKLTPVVHFLFDYLEIIPTDLHSLRCPELFKDLESVQHIRFSVFKSSLPIPNRSFEVHCASQVVWIVESVRLGSFDVVVCDVELVFNTKQLGEGVMIPK
jgi:hypothetical protein